MLKIKEKLLVMERYGRWLKSGKELTTYKCWYCEKEVLTEQPAAGDVGSKGFWDSLTVCLLCGGLNFVCVWSSGRTTSRKFPSK